MQRQDFPIVIRSRHLVIAAVVAVFVALGTSVALAAEGGRIDPVGGAADHGDLEGIDLVSQVVAMSSTPSGSGYWMVASDGGVFGFGDARFQGSMGGVPLNRPMVGMAATPTGDGYWLVASDGGVFAFGDARFHGSTGAIVLNRPIVGMAATPTGDGYWLVASDGGVFAFGDARFHGSTGAIVLNRPIVGMAATPTGDGYWLVASDGGIFTFGDARYRGSAPQDGFEGEFVGLVPSVTGEGYALVESTGRVLSYGDSALGRDPVCDSGPVVTGTVALPGAVLLRVDLPVPAGPASASSSGDDSAHMEAQLHHGQACQVGRVPAAGELGPPIADPIRTSSFGMRTHPVWGVRLLHAGADFIGAGGTAGAPALAAADGTVVEVESRVAYGTNVVIDHGDRIATVYAHLADVSVAVGDVVVRGQGIGSVGSTGFATGAHLHFEVRLDGVPVDPVPYLDAAVVSSGLASSEPVMW